jgi:hypothetical protein
MFKGGLNVELLHLEVCDTTNSIYKYCARVSYIRSLIHVNTWDIKTKL